MAGIDRRNGLQGMDKNYKSLPRATIRPVACALLALACKAAFAQFEGGRLERIQAHHPLGNRQTLRRLQKTYALLGGLLLLPALCLGQSAFDGTWRPDPQRPAHPKTEMAVLADGEYQCPSCTPPYTAKADGHDQALQGNPYFDTINIAIIDDHTIIKTGKKDGRVVADTKVVVSPGGATKTEIQTIIGMAPVPVELTSVFSRVSAGRPGSHAKPSMRALTTRMATSRSRMVAR
jgi:hypothetical protein